MSGEFRNLRGVRGLKVAVLKADTKEALTYETPVRFAGVREFGGETAEDTATEFYDNQPALQINSEGADEYSVITSVLEDMIKATIEGRKYDETTKGYFGTPLIRPYVAVGFIGKDTAGKEWYYWIYKGKFSGGNEKHISEDDGTETTNLEWTYTSIYTSHKFETAENKPMKFYKMPAGEGVTEEEFFATVYNPDTATA